MQSYSIASDLLNAKVLSRGAIIQDLRLKGVDHPLVLGLTNLADYEKYSPYFGAVVGRYANRIAGSRLVIDGEAHELDRNIDDDFTLHGGSDGFSDRDWKLVEAGDSTLLLALVSPDGDMGFPGELKVECLYELEGATLRITLTATTDKPTVCSLTNHSYFNLDDSQDILAHKLMINADARLEADDRVLPTGSVLAVEGTRYDFRQMRSIGQGPVFALDNNYCLSAERPRPLSHAATLQAGGLTMETWTNQPGLVVYTGEFIDAPVPSIHGRPYRPFAGIALEAAAWPDAPTHRHFPSAELLPGEVYRNVTEYRFKAF